MEAMSSNRETSRGDHVVAVGVLAVGLGAALLGWGFPADARLWPIFAVVVTLAGAVGALVQIVGFRGTASDDEQAEKLAAPVRAAQFVGLAVVFDLLLVNLGFVTAGIFAMLTMPLLLGERRWIPVLMTSAVFLVAAYLIFNKIVYKSLPADWFWS